MGLLAGRLLELELPRTDKRLMAILETDGCAADGVAVTTGCRVGKRTLRIEDFGKVAATFVDAQTERAVRIVPRPESRALAVQYESRAGVQAAPPGASTHWRAQLLAYQEIPDPLLLEWQPVALTTPVHTLVGADGMRVNCGRCGEEIINGRELVREGRLLCRSCAGHSYYRPVPPCAPLLLTA
jgi:formylmethanofuran dehydrogenase subunit E